MLKTKSGEQGQSLVEVVVALGIAIVVMVAFTNATISALREAQFAKNENQATRLAQKSLELIRAIRDQGNDVIDDDFNAGDSTTLSNDITFTDLWGTYLTASGRCFRLYENDLYMRQPNSGTCSTANDEQITVDNTVFTRRILMTNEAASTNRITITVTISWSDSKGTHNTEARTILTQWQ